MIIYESRECIVILNITSTLHLLFTDIQISFRKPTLENLLRYRELFRRAMNVSGGKKKKKKFSFFLDRNFFHHNKLVTFLVTDYNLKTKNWPYRLFFFSKFFNKYEYIVVSRKISPFISIPIEVSSMWKALPMSTDFSFFFFSFFFYSLFYAQSC